MRFPKGNALSKQSYVHAFVKTNALLENALAGMTKKSSLIYAKAEREGCLVMVMLIEIAVSFAGLPPHPALCPRRVERGFRKWIKGWSTPSSPLEVIVYEVNNLLFVRFLLGNALGED